MYTMQNRREKEGIVLFIRAGIQLQSKKGDFEAPVLVASWNVVVLAIQFIKTNIQNIIIQYVHNWVKCKTL